MKRFLASMMILATLLSLFGCDFKLGSQDETTKENENELESNEAPDGSPQINSDKIASVVLDYEKSLQNEVDRLQAIMPKYECFYQLTGKISCYFKLNDDVSVEDIIQKYDMRNLFSEAEIKVPSYSSSRIDITVDRDDFTEKMYQAFNRIAEEDPQIKYFSVMLDEAYVISTYAKIENYAEDVSKLKFENSANLIMKYEDSDGLIISTLEEFNEYWNSIVNSSMYEYHKDKIDGLKNVYNEEFFEEYALIETERVRKGSSSIDMLVKEVYLSDNTVYIIVQRDTPPGPINEDVVEWSTTIKVKKSDIENIEEVIVLH